MDLTAEERSIEITNLKNREKTAWKTNKQDKHTMKQNAGDLQDYNKRLIFVSPQRSKDEEKKVGQKKY